MVKFTLHWYIEYRIYGTPGQQEVIGSGQLPGVLQQHFFTHSLLITGTKEFMIIVG